ncbi:unnamed protein product [Protopolystoma xenopodis]|uniref:Uncharacterized protein n=1 Tax=Protopolystoma xenopodis TaxID=117903 RepID=A0A448X510_9PLAT|nr:unnamed protein product [Protopolystoma xenopodis]
MTSVYACPSAALQPDRAASVRRQPSLRPRGRDARPGSGGPTDERQSVPRRVCTHAGADWEEVRISLACLGYTTTPEGGARPHSAGTRDRRPAALRPASLTACLGLQPIRCQSIRLSLADLAPIYRRRTAPIGRSAWARKDCQIKVPQPGAQTALGSSRDSLERGHRHQQCSDSGASGYREDPAESAHTVSSTKPRLRLWTRTNKGRSHWNKFLLLRMVTTPFCCIKLS